ncbi:hypothetical protein [Nostoc sp. 106C]|uniref:hypothetical protein n=1 Tax=Nostoc sp. 106C TaxID=1932667 RepID=UPI00117E9274|nr:hypothetical protein [Nostoc sp. 106C]
MGGFPNLSEVAFELSETQQLQDFEVLGFVPQPNLHPLHPHHIFVKWYDDNSLLLVLLINLAIARLSLLAIANACCI